MQFKVCRELITKYIIDNPGMDPRPKKKSFGETWFRLVG
jgi:hypothetical protein